MELQDSRRLTGPNLICEEQGAVIDVVMDDEVRDEVVSSWRTIAVELQRAFGWDRAEPSTYVRMFDGGASLVLRAPIDGLYAACEANECAWDRAVAATEGREITPIEQDVERLRVLVEEERNPAMHLLAGSAESKGVGFLCDDDEVSLGFGTGSHTWPVRELPKVDTVPWPAVHDVPILLVTGTNGKSTTVRMLASIVNAAGRTPGFSSTDGLWIGDERIDTGDYSGPGGARTVLRDRRTEVALLETARGGMLRRGIGVPRANAAAILNVAEDHMGEYGVHKLEDLVEAKFIVRRAVAPDRPLVLNADDAHVVGGAVRGVQSPITWFTLDADNPLVVEHCRRGGSACLVEDGVIRFASGESRMDVVEVGAVPATMNGCARFNVANAMAAVALATAIDLPADAIAAGLRDFRSDPESNPGRGNVFQLEGVTAIVDFAHNPHGLKAFLEMANAMPAQRRLITLGMAGDRSDESIRDFVRTAWSARPDRVILKEMEIHLRGRELGVVPDLMADELRRIGVPENRIARASTEVEATRLALAWAEPGDLLLLSVLAERDQVIELLGGMVRLGWRPGQVVPN